MPSCNIVSQVDRRKVTNAIAWPGQEIRNLFGFWDSHARVEQTDLALTVYADDELELGRLIVVMHAQFTCALENVISVENCDR